MIFIQNTENSFLRSKWNDQPKLEKTDTLEAGAL